MFSVYRITNLLNSRYYYGVHETNNLNDSYLGSGIAIKRAVKKYGKHNFRKAVLFTFEMSVEAYAKEVELLQGVRQDPLCYNLHEGGQGGFKYINDNGLSDPGRAGHIAKEKGNTGRPKGSKGCATAITPDPRLLCQYGCGKPATYLVGRKENPCCVQHHGSCSAYLKRKKTMQVRPVGDSAIMCAYHCGNFASFLLGTHQTPCCSKTFYKCSGHWKNLRTFSDPELKQKAEATMLVKYGVANPSFSPEIQAKRDATNLERYGGLSPMCDSKVSKKRIRTNQCKFGGNAPACDPKVMAKILDTRRKSIILRVKSSLYTALIG